MSAAIHFATLPATGSWVSLCGAPGPQVHGTLVTESEITCHECRKRWKRGMKRVRALFRNYRGEE